MAAPITFGGIGSGIDVESIIDGLVSTSQDPINTLKSRQSSVDSAVSSLSDIGTLLATLKTSSGGLDTLQELGSYSATSSDPAVVASAAGNATPGSYNVSVSQLAQAERRYSDPIGTSSSAALGKSGTLQLQVGTGNPVDLTIDPTDSLDTVISKINGAGLRLNASAFYDGSQYRVQVRGADTGVSNYLTIDETGLSSGFGFNGVDNKVAGAQNAKLKVDGFSVESATNKVTGSIPGVTLALTATTTTNATVTIASDSSAFQKKLQDVVDGYNAVVQKIHAIAGFGSVQASNATLSGDSSLRSITSQLSDALEVSSGGTGKYQTLSSIGMQLNNDGTLMIDSTKLTEAIDTDSDTVGKLLAGTDTTPGVMDSVYSLIDTITGPNGTLSSRKDGLSARSTDLGKQIDEEQTRLDNYAASLHTQFSQMDSVVSANQAQLQYLSSLK